MCIVPAQTIQSEFAATKLKYRKVPVPKQPSIYAAISTTLLRSNISYALTMNRATTSQEKYTLSTQQLRKFILN